MRMSRLSYDTKLHAHCKYASIGPALGIHFSFRNDKGHTEYDIYVSHKYWLFTHMFMCWRYI